MRASSSRVILTCAVVAGLAAALLVAGCGVVASLDEFHVVPGSDTSGPDGGANPDASDEQGPDAAGCGATAFCRDMDRDGYVTQRWTGCPSNLPGVRADWHPCSELPFEGARDEPLACDADAARHPDATPVCGADADCDGVPDVPLGGGCSAEETLERKVTLHDPSCAVDYPAIERCSRDTVCMTSAPEPVRAVRRYLPTEMLHDEQCGAYETGVTTNWRVEASNSWECYAQRGPGVNDIPPGRYRVGFLVSVTTGSADVVVDVTNGDVRIAGSDRKRKPSGSRTCVVVEDVELGPCRAHQFRLWYDGGHSLTLHSTLISPFETPGDACSDPPTAQQLRVPVVDSFHSLFRFLESPNHDPSFAPFTRPAVRL